MSFFDDLISGLGEVAGKTLALNEWRTTLTEEGVSMLQIKIRNFLREASAAERRERAKDLQLQASGNSDAQQRNEFSTIYEVYKDELAEFDA